jgi:multicomponent Na+:H+ antiporter subunit F
MSAADTILSFATWMALAISAVAFLLTVWRVVKGPTLPDRVVALDMLVGIVIGFIALIAIRTGFTLYIDIAIALGLVGFLATIAFARFILAKSAKAPRQAASAAVSDGAGPPEAEPHQGKPAEAKKAQRAKASAGKGTAKKSSAKPPQRKHAQTDSRQKLSKPVTGTAEKPATKRSGNSQELSPKPKKPTKPGKVD